MLRRGNQHSAKYWKKVLIPVIERYRHHIILRFFCGDAAFTIPELYALPEKEGFKCAIRLKPNAVLQDKIVHLLTRPVGRLSQRPKVFYYSFEYQAASWDLPRRIVAKVEWHNGELFPRMGFIITNMTGRPNKIARFYNRRGTVEEWIKEGKNAV